MTFAVILGAGAEYSVLVELWLEGMYGAGPIGVIEFIGSLNRVHQFLKSAWFKRPWIFLISEDSY